MSPQPWFLKPTKQMELLLFSCFLSRIFLSFFAVLWLWLRVVLGGRATSMLRHTGALRPVLRCSRRLASSARSSGLPNPHDPRAASESSIALNRPGLLLCCRLHHDTSRRRGCNAIPPIPVRSSKMGDKRRAWDGGIPAAVAGAQRVSFSAGKEGARKRGGGAKEHTMDEETRKSIGHGDEKTKKSMQTVKVRDCNVPQQGNHNLEAQYTSSVRVRRMIVRVTKSGSKMMYH